MFVKDIDIVETIQYASPLCNSDHVLIEAHLRDGNAIMKEDCKVRKFRYKSTVFFLIKRCLCYG